MDLTTYFLSFERLSHKSLFFWGHATTSGVTNVNNIYKDYLTQKTSFCHTNSHNHSSHRTELCQLLSNITSVFNHSSSTSNKNELLLHNYTASAGPDYFVSSALFEGRAQQQYDFYYRFHKHNINSTTTYTTDANNDNRDVLTRSCGEWNCYSYCLHPTTTNNNNHNHTTLNATLICTELKRLIRSNTIYSQFEYSERLILMSSITTYFEHPVTPLTYADVIINDNITTRITGINVSQLPSKLDYLLYLNPDLRLLLASFLSDDSSPDVSPNDKHTATTNKSNFHLYGLPQTLYKLHPDFDMYVIAILIQDRCGYIVLPSANGNSNKRLNTEVLGRIRRKLQIAIQNETYMNMTLLKHIYTTTSTNNNHHHHHQEQEHVIDEITDIIMTKLLFVRPLNEKEYVTLCAVSDLILDPFPVGGG